MDIQALLSAYLLEHQLRPKSAEQLALAARQFAEFLGRKGCAKDFTDEAVSGWLMHLEECGRAQETLRTKRCTLLCLWNSAFRKGLVDLPPRYVRKIKRADIVPQCWTLEEMRRLLSQCDQLEGCFRKLKLPRRLYFRSLVNAKYDSALRLGDVLSLERSWIWPGGYLSIVQHKTGRAHRVQLRDSTLAEIDELMALMPERRLIWPAFADRRRFYRAFKQLVTRAGLRGSSKWLRRSSASYYEREHPGEAWRHLGHTAPGLDRRSYLDPRVAYPPPCLPPRIA